MKYEVAVAQGILKMQENPFSHLLFWYDQCLDSWDLGVLVVHTALCKPCHPLQPTS